MDLSKYPLEKLVYFVAGIIPGFVALVIFHLAAPGSFEWLFALGFLGYKMKLTVILVSAFVAGNSLTTFLVGILGAAGWWYGIRKGKEPYEASYAQNIAPWRDPRWRTVLKQLLGPGAPNDTVLITEELFKLKVQGVEFLPETERPAARYQLGQEKLRTQMDDLQWEQWYDQYHKIVFERHNKDFQWFVRAGLHINLETTAVYVLFSALFVPALRHWWCLLPALLWTLVLVATEYYSIKKAMNKWSSVNLQIEYISGLPRKSNEAAACPA